MSTHDYWLSFARYTPLGIVTDLDGTLLPFAPTPNEARPGPELIRILTDLASLPDVTLAVVSGRPRESLDRLLDLPRVLLVAEHGGWRRAGGAWQSAVDLDVGALDALAAELGPIVAAYAGALLERKTWSLTVHHRLVHDSEIGELRSEVAARLDPWLAANAGFERRQGPQALEVVLARLRKSTAVTWVRDRVGADARLLALGDDVTDEDVFRSLNAADESIVVSPRRGRPTAARWRLEGPAAATAFLRDLVRVRSVGEGRSFDTLPRPSDAQRDAHDGERRHGLLIVSNRLPDLRSGARDERRRNVGGLVSALEPVLVANEGLWLGWSGRTLPEVDPTRCGLDDESSPRLASIDFPENWHRHYYNGLCNSALWPLFHCFPGRARFSDTDWQAYSDVNDALARVASELVGAGDPVWAHDYHLLLFAQRLRSIGHPGPIGLFLHIPFPPTDIFAIFPWAETLLDAMLEYDLIGFHTPGYVANFRHCVATLLGAPSGDDVVVHRGRRTRVGAFPIGIIPEGFRETADPEVVAEVTALKERNKPACLIIGVDRLDYTKGIPERLTAFGRFLELFPEWRGRVSLIQISVPSREDVPEYAEQRSRIENVVGRINGQYGETNWVPIRYLYRSYEQQQLAELYRAASVGYVTPLRDGMNLVAKEYVAAQDPEDPGVLLLSSFAGAAVELRDAVLTNPWDADGMARDLNRALRMDLEERKTRHSRLLAVVSRTTALTWAQDFMEALRACR
jgi:alpha,alpha-trehalose-phosphate synthase [UDP-forming]/trehalose-phosphatase